MRVFDSPSLATVLTDKELTEMVSDFKHYKKAKKVALNLWSWCSLPLASKAVNEELFHLHLAEGSEWNHRTIQYSRTSDFHLVYSRGFIDPNNYVLLAILKPNAHKLARNREVVELLADQAAVFRSRYWSSSWALNFNPHSPLANDCFLK